MPGGSKKDRHITSETVKHETVWLKSKRFYEIPSDSNIYGGQCVGR